MRKAYKLVIVGATGVVGETFLAILAERKFPLDELFLVASARSAGKKITFQGKTYTVQDLALFDFKQANLAFFTAGSDISAQYAEKAVAAGCIVIDDTSYFRYEKDIPLVIAEVNPEAIKQAKERRIIANPNCTTIPMLVALKPLYDTVGIKRINIATYQSVSGTGKKGVDELTVQTRAILSHEKIPNPEVYPYPIAFNAIPHIDAFQANGYTKEEMKIVWETRKILENEEIQINPTCVRIPVYYGHSEVIHLETLKKITAKEAETLLKQAPGVAVINQPEAKGYPTAVSHAAGHDPVYVGRIREDISCEKGLNLWLVSDNIRKGAALNVIQIAELLSGFF